MGKVSNNAPLVIGGFAIGVGFMMIMAAMGLLLLFIVGLISAL